MTRWLYLFQFTYSYTIIWDTTHSPESDTKMADFRIDLANSKSETHFVRIKTLFLYLE